MGGQGSGHVGLTPAPPPRAPPDLPCRPPAYASEAPGPWRAAELCRPRRPHWGLGTSRCPPDPRTFPHPPRWSRGCPPPPLAVSPVLGGPSRTLALVPCPCPAVRHWVWAQGRPQPSGAQGAAGFRSAGTGHRWPSLPLCAPRLARGAGRHHQPLGPPVRTTGLGHSSTEGHRCLGAWPCCDPVPWLPRAAGPGVQAEAGASLSEGHEAGLPLLPSLLPC